MTIRRVFGSLLLALLIAGCGDNNSPPVEPTSTAGVHTSVAGGLVARSPRYRIVSTVTTGDLSATSAAHSVRGVTAEGGAR